MHNHYKFTIFHKGFSYEVEAKVVTDTDGSGRPLIEVQLYKPEDSEDVLELVNLIGVDELRSRIIDAYNELEYLDVRN